MDLPDYLLEWGAEPGDEPELGLWEYVLEGLMEGDLRRRMAVLAFALWWSVAPPWLHRFTLARMIP
jgi:hypothetical protein